MVGIHGLIHSKETSRKIIGPRFYKEVVFLREQKRKNF
jgi:hypothetical protein